MATRIGDANTKVSVDGTEKIPCSGENYPAITPNLLREFMGAMQDWTGTHGGFLAAPTYVAKYVKVGDLFLGVYSCSANGTSSGTSYTFTFPTGITAKAGFSQHGYITSMVDGGSALTGTGRWFTTAGSGTITLNTNGAGAAWTGTATGKRANFVIMCFVDQA
jgi:hypothetical protein